MGAEAQESVDLQALTFDQLAEAARLAAKAVQERPVNEDRIEYFTANDHLGLSMAAIYKAENGRYCIFLPSSCGNTVPQSFANIEEAKAMLVNGVLIPNGYRLM